MSEVEPVLGVLLAHGTMARGMVDAARKISGVGEDALMPLSNEGKSPGLLEEELNALLSNRPALIFTDLSGGSCALAAQVCCRREGGRVVVFGVNLPILLDFLFHRHLPLEELVPRLLAKGRESLRSVPEYSDDAHRPVSS